MLGMKNHFDISGSIEIREVDIAGVACIFYFSFVHTKITHSNACMGKLCRLSNAGVAQLCGPRF